MPAPEQDSKLDITKEFEWIKVREEVQRNTDETFKGKLMRKTSEQPLVPIGCFVTLGILSYGLWSFRKGNKQMSQYMMRARVLAQGFTVAALGVGLGITATRGVK